MGERRRETEREREREGEGNRCAKIVSYNEYELFVVYGYEQKIRVSNSRFRGKI